MESVSDEIFELEKQIEDINLQHDLKEHELKLKLSNLKNIKSDEIAFKCKMINDDRFIVELTERDISMLNRDLTRIHNWRTNVREQNANRSKRKSTKKRMPLLKFEIVF